MHRISRYVKLILFKQLELLLTENKNWGFLSNILQLIVIAHIDVNIVIINPMDTVDSKITFNTATCSRSTLYFQQHSLKNF